MKNIHILPTDKLTKISISKKTNTMVYNKDKHDTLVGFINQNIYITNDEKIKEGDWVVAIEGIWKNTITKVTGEPIADVWRKIILTTDQDLINNGIEQISEDTLLKIVEHINSGKNIESFDEKKRDENNLQTDQNHPEQN